MACPQPFARRLDDCGAQMGKGAGGEPDWGMASQPVPEYEVDQRINW